MIVNYSRPDGEGGTWSIRFEIFPDGKNVRLMRMSGWIHNVYTSEPYMNLPDLIAIHEELQLLAKYQPGIFSLIASQIQPEGSIHKWVKELTSEQF